jgi:hypothetical protein
VQDRIEVHAGQNHLRGLLQDGKLADAGVNLFHRRSLNVEWWRNYT